MIPKTEEQMAAHVKRIEDGGKAAQFLQSDEWNQFVKPILDSYVKGLLDASTIDVSSDTKAAVEVKSRTLAAKYINSIGALLQGYVEDGEMSKKALAPAEEKAPLYKRKTQE